MTYATLSGPGLPTFLIPRHSDRRLPYAEWGVWGANLSDVIGIELGERVKNGIISENGKHGRVHAVTSRARFPKQENGWYR